MINDEKLHHARVSKAHVALLLIVVLFTAGIPASADEFDTLRLKWRDMLTMGTNANPADPLYSGWISLVGSNAQRYWSSINTNSGRTYLWSDLNHLSSNSLDITSTYGRIRALAMGYAVHGSILETNVALRGTITKALDWIYTNYYNEHITSTNDNWFDWKIGSPLNLNDITVLMYDNLTGSQITNYMNAVDRWTPYPDGTGANEVWEASVVAVRGAIVKSSPRLLSARQALSDVFPYVTNGDGFYTDGSFLFHTIFPYNSGYGVQLIATMGPLIQLLNGSSWEVIDPLQTNLFRWIYDSCEPFIYNGAMMQMVNGRYYTREGDDHLDGSDAIGSILRIAQFAPTADAAVFKSKIKYWIQTDRYQSFVATQPPPFNVWANDVLNDANVIPWGELVRHYQFPRMDRVVHLRPGWGFGIAMSSARIGNYESIRGENLRGWYTGDGMTYLYNADLAHYADGFWPTVNSYRLPGTTVDTQTRSNASGQSYRSSITSVGGASIQDLYGVTGMQLNAWNSTLSAKKSWFMFDNEVVCLGAGITSTDNRTIETTVENRRLEGYGNNAFTVNGTVKPQSVGWAETMSNTSWAHIKGNVPGADIGYVFPQPATIKALREARAGSLSDLNSTYGSANPCTRNFLTLWFDHGANPSNATYAYVMLPNLTATQVTDYAANPDIVVLENSTRAQGVKETTLGITAVNFWKDGTNRLGSVVVDKKSSVVTRNDGTFLDVGISDPTQTNTGVINLEISAAAATTLWADAGISVLQISPTIKLAANVNGTAGQTLHARFFVGATQTLIVSPVADTYVQNGPETNSNFGTLSSLAVKASGTSQTRETYLRFDLPTNLGILFNATLRLVPITVNEPIYHAVASVPDNSWMETGITWNNKPASDLEFARWLVSPAATPVPVPVTALAQQAAAAGGNLSLRVYSTGTPTPTNGGYTAYASRENGTALNRPQLTLTLGRIPPTIELATQPDKTVYDAPASFTLTADAQDADGFVTNVQFYHSSTKLAQSSAAPYIFTLTNLPAGQYSFTAVAADNTGLMSTSMPVNLFVFTPEPQGRGVGLIGEYYTNQNLTGLALTRTDPTVNFLWGFGSPAPALPIDRFSVRWTGKLQTRHAGTHIFHTVSDDGMRLWVDGQLLIDNWITHLTTEDTGSIQLLPGQYYDISLEYYDGINNAVAQLYWTEPGGIKEIIPQTQLYPANTGLMGSYFSGTNLTSLVFTRIDGAVNFSWANSSPDPNLLVGSFSVRWTSKVHAAQSGAYTFYTRTDDGVRLWVNKQLLINDWTVHPASESSNSLMLAAGQLYDLTMEYFNSSGEAVAVLMWAPPGETKQVIPNGNLTPHQNNSPPLLAPIPNQVAAINKLLAFTVTATDRDAPGQSLTYSLDAGSPTGAAINPTTGLFMWVPVSGPGNYSAVVRVADNGTPLMTDAQAVSIVVTPEAVLDIAASANGATLSWPLEPALFQLYTATNLLPPITWSLMSNPPVQSNGQWIVILPPLTNHAQFFRLQTQ